MQSIRPVMMNHYRSMGGVRSCTIQTYIKMLNVYFYAFYCFYDFTFCPNIHFYMVFCNSFCYVNSLTLLKVLQNLYGGRPMDDLTLNDTS